jgi:hypothetical protein
MLSAARLGVLVYSHHQITELGTNLRGPEERDRSQPANTDAPSGNRADSADAIRSLGPMHQVTTEPISPSWPAFCLQAGERNVEEAVQAQQAEQQARVDASIGQHSHSGRRHLGRSRQVEIAFRQIDTEGGPSGPLSFSRLQEPQKRTVARYFHEEAIGTYINAAIGL